MTTILVVDDDATLRRTLTLNLEARGYATLTAGDGTAALQALREHAVDVVVLDLGLPDMSGQEVLTELRGWSAVPVVVLSARDGSRDKVAALDAGADDYVTKPFGIEELLARLRAATRRVAPAGPPLAGDGLEVDLENRLARRDGEEVRLTPTEWGVLVALASRPGRLVPQRQLLREVWGPAYDKETNYLRVYVAALRRKLERDPARPRHLLTEPGMGYRFIP